VKRRASERPCACGYWHCGDCYDECVLCGEYIPRWDVARDLPADTRKHRCPEPEPRVELDLEGLAWWYDPLP
jgi:hypothetical protein